MPKALSAAEAADALDAVGDLAERPWIAKRDRALLTLLYGCGLRIGEALALNRADAPRADGSMVVTGKGNKQRAVPVLPVVAAVSPNFPWASLSTLWISVGNGPAPTRVV